MSNINATPSVIHCNKSRGRKRQLDASDSEESCKNLRLSVHASARSSGAKRITEPPQIKPEDERVQNSEDEVVELIKDPDLYYSLITIQVSETIWRWASMGLLTPCFLSSY